MNRQLRRCEKALDELLKIADDGHGADTLRHLLDQLREFMSRFK